MYQAFNIISFDILYAEMKIIIYTNFDVSPISVNSENIKLYDSTLRNSLNISFEVINKNIIINILDDIVPNVEYTLSVSQIKTVLDDELASGIRRKIMFESQVKELAKIIRPTMHEEITNINIAMEATLNNQKVTLGDDKYFYVEIASDVAFINIVESARAYSDILSINTLLPLGQYYIRARIEMGASGSDIPGRWSDTCTFILVQSQAIEPGWPDPVVLKELQVITKYPNGETPSSLLIEFSNNILKESVNNIIVIRRDV